MTGNVGDGHVFLCNCCGLCASACPAGAIGIVRKEDAEMTTPPDDEMDWCRRKAAQRGIDISRFI